MAYGRPIRRGGAGAEYNRLVLPDWADPLDSSYSQANGGRWNAPGSFPVVYLNAGQAMARRQVLHKLQGQPYQPEDLDPSEQHDLLVVELPEADYVDCVTADGLTAVGLPDSYPRDADGSPVEWDRCQPVGQAAWDAGEPGIACRSAAEGADNADEELAHFDRPGTPGPTPGPRMPFADWFLGA